MRENDTTIACRSPCLRDDIDAADAVGVADAVHLVRLLDDLRVERRDDELAGLVLVRCLLRQHRRDCRAVLRVLQHER